MRSYFCSSAQRNPARYAFPSPDFAGPVQHVHPRRGGRQLVGQLAGAIGRVVVHHQDFEPRILLEDGRHDEREVDPLVVGRHDDQQTLSHERGEGAGRRPAM